MTIFDLKIAILIKDNKLKNINLLMSYSINIV